MSQLERRVTELEQRAGVVGLDVGALAPDDAAFYQGVMRRLARHPKGFESFIKTLADDDLERLIGIEIKLMSDADCARLPAELRDEWQAVRVDLVESLARRKERNKRHGL